MNWLIISLLAGFFFALSRVVARFVLRDGGNPLAFVAVHDFIAGLILLPLLFFGFHFPQNNITWLYFVGIIVFAFLSDWFTFIALKKINVSVYQIINQVRHVFVLFGGFIFFSEAISGFKLVATFLIIIGVVVMLYERSKFQLSAGVGVTILSTLFAIVAFFFVKYAVTDFSETAMVSFELMSIGLLGFGLLGFDKDKIIQEIKLNRWGLAISGALFGLFELLVVVALKYGDISRVLPVVQSALVFGVVMGVIFLKERERMWQKAVGTVIIVVGIILMNFL